MTFLIVLFFSLAQITGAIRIYRLLTGEIMHRLLMTLLLLGVFISGAAAADDIFAQPFYSDFKNLDQHLWYVSNGWSNGNHQGCEWRADALSVIRNKLRITLSDHGGKIRPYGCGEIQTRHRMSYGLYEARLRTAAGQGLNTAFFTYIGPPQRVPEWDEIDFEFLGKAPAEVQLNYYVNGNKKEHEKTVSLGFDASKAFHNYAFEWLPDKIRWYVDGRLVHETKAGDAMPRNPPLLYLSLWAGARGEDAWLGHFDYKSPVTAEVEWAGYTPEGKSCLFPQSMTCK